MFFTPIFQERAVQFPRGCMTCVDLITPRTKGRVLLSYKMFTVVISNTVNIKR